MIAISQSIQCCNFQKAHGGQLLVWAYILCSLDEVEQCLVPSSYLYKTWRGWQTFRNFVTLAADYEGHDWKHDLARLYLCYIPRNSLEIILEFIGKEAVASLISVAAPLWFWRFLLENQKFGFFGNLKISRFWKIMGESFFCKNLWVEVFWCENFFGW